MLFIDNGDGTVTTYLKEVSPAQFKRYIEIVSDRRGVCLSSEDALILRSIARLMGNKYYGRA